MTTIRYTHFHWLIYKLKRSRQEVTRTCLKRGCVRSFHERQKQTESEMKGLILIRLLDESPKSYFKLGMNSVHLCIPKKNLNVSCFWLFANIMNHTISWVLCWRKDESLYFFHFRHSYSRGVYVIHIMNLIAVIILKHIV